MKKILSIVLVFTLLIPVGLSFAEAHLNSAKQDDILSITQSWKNNKSINDLPKETKLKLLKFLDSPENSVLKTTSEGKFIANNQMLVGVSDVNELVVLERISDNCILYNGKETIKITEENLSAQSVDNNIVPFRYYHRVSQEEADAGYGSWEYHTTRVRNLELERKLRTYSSYALALILYWANVGPMVSALIPIAYDLITDNSINGQYYVKAKATVYLKPQYEKHYYKCYGKNLYGNLIYVGSDTEYYGY